MMAMDALSWVNNRALGKGSYGTVHLATSNIPFLPHFAVKSCLLFSYHSEALEKEILILDHLRRCPEIVRCLGYKITVHGDKPILNLLLEYASGGTLSDVIRDRGGLLWEADIRCFTRMLLRGLQAIHANGIVHCDFKPENILAFPSESKDCGDQTQLKIADFGLAMSLGESYTSYSSKFRGTPLYMSPESVAAALITPGLDIWSLGCVVVEMYTGRPAMERDQDVDRLAWDLMSMEDTGVLIPETMSLAGKDFLSRCFALNLRERWTAEMLLQHPFLCGSDGDRTRTALPTPGSSYSCPIVLD